MAGTAVLGRLTWLVAEVVGLVSETPRVRTIVLDVPGWAGHRAGQHLDVRLTAEDGYQAQRSYSIASSPGEPIAITVEVLDDGEVSPYLAEELREGDEIEVRGPIGGYFVWEPGGDEPLLLVAGGSGIVPLMAMIRHRAAAGDRTPTRLVYSSRRLEEVIYRTELEELAGRDDGLEALPDADSRAAARVGGVLAQDRRGADAGGRVGAFAAARGLRMRVDRLRRVGRGSPRRARARSPAHQDRALRRHGRRLMERLDGNAIGGVLAEIFGTEMTVAVGVCGSCGATGPVAELHVYMRAPGIVVRCSTCESVLLKIVQSGRRTWIDLSGTRTLQFETASPPADASR